MLDFYVRRSPIACAGGSGRAIRCRSVVVDSPVSVETHHAPLLQAGQVWENTDPRYLGRRVRIEGVNGNVVEVQTIKAPMNPRSIGRVSHITIAAFTGPSRD